MFRMPLIVPALAAAALFGAPLSADPTAGPACGTQVPVLQAALDTGDAAAVDHIRASLLDDPSVETYLASLETEAADDWFAVLFHPAFVASLVSDTPARQAQWDVLAGVIEDAYVPGPAIAG